jgi:hypothetical protein
MPLRARDAASGLTLESRTFSQVALNYQGMQIEIGEATTNPRFYNHRDGRWEDQRIDLLASSQVDLYGVQVRIMPKDELLAYKAMLERDVDLFDIAQLTAAC